MIVFACLLAMSATVLAAPTSTMMQMSIADGPTPKPLLMKDTQMLLTTDYPKEEKGFTSNSDGTYLVAANTAMPGVTGKMIDWWFGYVTTTEQYIRWHPKDHVYSEWVGPHGNSRYIGGAHQVYEKIGGQLQYLRLSFKDPSEYFGPDYKAKFAAAKVETAVCGRVGMWAGKGTNTALEVGHVIHLVQKEGDGVRMRSRFWLGDIAGLPLPAAMKQMLVPKTLVEGLVTHSSEEMKILAGFLPDLYKKNNGQ